MDGEKVYGICGTNKCRKEVWSKGEVVVLESPEKSWNKSEYGYVASHTFTFPEGFTKDNTIILADQAFIRNKDSAVREWMSLASVDAYIACEQCYSKTTNLGTSLIIEHQFGTNYGNVIFRVVLMKIS